MLALEICTSALVIDGCKHTSHTVVKERGLSCGSAKQDTGPGTGMALV